MPIAFAHVSIHTRSKGHSAIAASAYRTASLLRDDRTGKTYDFRNKPEVVYAELLLPEIANDSFKNREFLWNQAELSEKRKDAQVCKDIVLALPKELDLAQHIELAKRFAQTHCVENGLPADIAIHDHEDGNPHAHILTSTRRLEKNGFSKYKARDLNPGFAKGRVVEKEYWGERWREVQNDYFIEKNIDLSVDLNHVISERHQGKIRGKDNHFLKEENQFIQQERLALARNSVESIITHLSQQHSVFSLRDVQHLLFKTFRDSDKPEEYLSYVEQVMAHKDVVNLGENDRGKICFTTCHQYIQEARLRADIEKMLLCNNHIVSAPIDTLATRYTLSEEQRGALDYIAHTPDIGVVIGRPGTGKSYLLKPVKEYFEAGGYQVIGASLSGKVAKSLQSETGIASSTLASLNYRLTHEKLRLTRKHVIIVDEAGMVDFNTMVVLLNKARKAGSKVLLIGDPEQLKPIQKGEIFRGIAAITGYIELENITRQQDAGDRQASLNMARGNITEALNHYHAKGGVHLHETPEAASEQLIADWQKQVKSDTLKDSILLAFTRKAVADLNDKARQVLIDKHLLGSEEVTYQGFEKKLNISTGERLLFRQNDKALGVRNGDIGTVTAIHTTQFQVKLDSGELLNIPKTYHAMDYGYALTVHKSQGMTAKDVSVLIDSKYWDKHLAFVAMTRHKNTVKLYADKINHPALNDLKRTLSRSTIKDNVIDWPLDFAIRAGFNPDKLVGKAVNHLAGMGHKIKNGFNYLVNYETYFRNNREKGQDKKNLKLTAKQAAALQDGDSVKQPSDQFETLKKEYPLFKEYENLLQQRKNKSGYFAEKMDRQITQISQVLEKNIDFMVRARQVAPSMASHITQHLKGKEGHGLDR